MNVLFIHQNFPGQYKHLAPVLAQQGHRVVGLGETKQRPDLPGVEQLGYHPPQSAAVTTHQYLQSFEAHVRRGQQVVRALQQLQRTGFSPDLIWAHPGWGEALYLKDIYPRVPLVGLFEFYYRSQGGDVGFDPEFPADLDRYCRARTRNAHLLIALEAVDWGVCPTAYQRSVHPEVFHPKLRVIHDGIDTDLACPNPTVSLTLHQPGQPLTLTQRDEIITFVNRNLEPYRGYHIFMRALPQLLRQRPQARVIIVGGEGVSYGTAAPDGTSWKQICLQEVQPHIDLNRVHFFDRLPYHQLIQLFQVSSVHVYLTCPFVLSWSMLEAMGCGGLVIGSRTPPVEEVIQDGENGLLVDFFSPEQICDRIHQVLNHPDRMQSLRHQARQTILEHYDLKQVCLPQQLNLIQQVLGKGV